MSGTFEVITIGRVGIDIYPHQIGVGLEDVETFGKFLGGSATNVAVAAARLGRRSAVITRTGRDSFGKFVHKALQDFDVDDRFVSSVPDLLTPVTFCEIFPPDDFPLWFYRLPKAPDLEIRLDGPELSAIKASNVFWATLTGFSQEPSRSAHYAALDARNHSQNTILDLDYRPAFWSSKQEASEQARQALAHVTVAIGNQGECEVATGETNAIRAAHALLDAGVELAIVKQGPAGVLGMTADETVVVPPLPVEVVNGLGAGDGFGGSVCHGLIAGWPLEQILRYANAAGSIVAGRLECSNAMPTAAEVEDRLAGAQ